MKLLVIESAGNLWGSERALLDLLDGLRGIKAAICCPPGTALQAELETRSIPTFPYFIYGLHNKSKWRRLQAAFGVLRACLRWRPDVIYLNQSGVYRTVLPAARILRLPIVAHVRIFEDVDYLARQAPDPVRLSGLIAISRAIESAIDKAPSLRLIRRYCLYDAYARAPSLSAGAPERALNCIACVGRVVPVKGQDVLIGAMALFASEGMAPACLMVGEGDEHYLSQLKSASPKTVQWLGFVRDVVPLLRSCTFLVCPSRIEPLGRVIFEAWDAGALPVVCAQSGGAAEIVAASGGGILYDLPTPQSLAVALRQGLALDNTAREGLIQKGRIWMESHCDPRSYGAAISNIFLDAALGAVRTGSAGQ
jgi:glycosyltransferase involved in cell wall biosynthesis